MGISWRDLKVGDNVRIVDFDPRFAAQRQKLLAMGLTPGTEFTVIRIAPLGDPVAIRVRGTDLSLRRDEITVLTIDLVNSVDLNKHSEEAPQSATVAVIGNPNCGKTTLFNGLTGARQHVGNWAGVTVEQKTGQYRYDNKIIQLVDLPGIYALDVHEENSALDEKIARDYILSMQADLIINIVDTTHLEHNLYLTAQLLEMRLPIVIVLNIMDDASGRDLKIDSDEIARRLKCPLVSLMATSAMQVNSFKSVVNRLLDNPSLSQPVVTYPAIIQTAIEQLAPMIEQQIDNKAIDARWFAVKLLERDRFAVALAGETLNQQAAQLRHNVEQSNHNDIDVLLADSRYDFIHTLTQETVTELSQLGRQLSDAIDRIVLNRFLAVPIFFGVMYLMFTFTIKMGRVFKPFFNDIAQTIFVDAVRDGLIRLDSPQWLTALLAEGVGNGIREVAAFIPILGFLYLFISVLEESGYMARATFAMDRFMRFLGLPGKAFVPLILGFGCNVPAMMATRTLEHPRDRVLNILLNPFMTCGARLAVFTVFAVVFFPEHGEWVVFTLYLIGIIVAVFTALLLKHTFLKERFSLLVMEIPRYHIPKLKNVWLNTWTRVKTFVFRVGKIIISMVLLLQILSAWGTDGTFGERNIEHSVLSAAGRAVTPVLAPMGITERNWPATVAVFTGILHKVVVISTLKTLYAETGSAGPQPPDSAFDFWGSVKRAFSTIPLQLKKIFGSKSIAQNSGERAFADSLQKHFHGQIGAFAYLLFVLLYFPCIATIATAYKESGTGWSLFMVIWSTGLAYLSATLFYQLATYRQHPATATAWIVGGILVILATVLAFRYWGKRQQSAILK